jgi:hypothetical protein
MLYLFYNPESPKNLILYFQSLSGIEVTEVSLIEEDRPYFQLVHYSKSRESCLNMQLIFFYTCISGAEICV